MSAAPDQILYDTHMHTPLCKHAVGEPEEYAAAAEARGLGGIIVTCHNPDPDGWSPKVRMDLGDLDRYVSMVERARRAWAGRIDVRLGIESDFVPGMEPWLERLHRMAEFHYVIGSVHCHLPQYRERYFTGDVRAFQETYFEHLALAAETGLFDCISHPDLVKNDFPEDWDPAALMDAIVPALERIARSGAALELNTSGLNKRVAEMNPGPLILREMRRLGIPVVVGSDAHWPMRVGAEFRAALGQLEEAGYHLVRFFLERRAVDVPIAEAALRLSPGKAADQGPAPPQRTSAAPGDAPPAKR
jgi:histidinol-phosphatase (PHP family)